MLPQRFMPLDDDACPIGDQQLGAMYRASAKERDEFIATMSPTAKALLALYCYRRGHLSVLGLTLAADCEKDDLLHWGGHAGGVLFDRSRQPQTPPASDVPTTGYGRRKITLATALLNPRALNDDEEPPDQRIDEAADEVAAAS
jgi:hypothetical protein